MMFGKSKKSDPASEAEIKLQQVIDILFPPLTLHTDRNGNKYHVDYSADANLEAALYDLEEGGNDEITQSTVRKVADNLFKVRQMLDIQNELNPDANYYVIDCSDKAEPDIKASDDYG